MSQAMNFVAPSPSPAYKALAIEGATSNPRVIADLYAVDPLLSAFLGWQLTKPLGRRVHPGCMQHR